MYLSDDRFMTYVICGISVVGGWWGVRTSSWVELELELFGCLMSGVSGCMSVRFVIPVRLSSDWDFGMGLTHTHISSL